MGLPTWRSTTRSGGLTWPVVLITLGGMFLVDEFVPGWGISRTWPVLLVVIGIMKLLNANRPPWPPEGPRV